MLQPDKLLDPLEQNYEPTKDADRVRLKAACDFNQLPQYLNGALAGADFPLVATGLSSVSRYATMQREESLSLYCPDLKRAQAIVSGKETERFFNIELILPTSHIKGHSALVNWRG